MSRAFNGTTDSITLGPGSAPRDQGGAGNGITIVVLAKAANTAGFTGWMARGRKTGTAVWSSLTSNNAGAKLFMENDFGSGVGGLTTDWAYYVVTKATGSALPRWHTKNVTTNAAWVHTNGSANVANGTGNIDDIFIGQAFPGSFAVVAAIEAVWADLTIEANCTYAAVDLFNAVNSAGWMIRLNQASTAASVTNDAAGGGNQTAISGTSIDVTGTPDPPGYNYSISSGSTVAPTGIAIAAGLGSHTAVNSMDAVTPGGIAVARALGNPTLVWSATAVPGGIVVPVALGQPVIANAMDAATPNGLAVACALGNPTLVQTFTSAPSGLAIPVALGQPTVAQLAGQAFPTGQSLPVALGAPTVAGQPYVAPQVQGSWWTLLSAIKPLTQPPVVACPNDGEPLRTALDGVRYCPYDLWTPESVSRTQRPGSSGRDWGGVAGVLAGAVADQKSVQMLSRAACPHDGEPYSVTADGVKFCKYDAYLPEGGSMPLNPHN